MRFIPPRRSLIVLTLLSSSLLCSCNEVGLQQSLAQLSTQFNQPAALTTGDIAAGLKEALQVGSERVVGQVGRNNGYNSDPAIRIPLPPKLATAREKLARVGLGGTFDDLEVRFNRAAEAAAPKAKAIFWQAIQEMTLDDARAILKGENDAATRYFQRKTSRQLSAALRPVIDDSLDQVGAIRVYREVVRKVEAIPFAPEVKTDLSGYVVEKAMAGLFHYLAAEEAAIRADPAKRTSELLRRVFAER